MNYPKHVFIFLCACLSIENIHAINRTFKTAGIFANNMVLQRDMPIPVWGWDTTGQTVSVVFSGNTVTATADVNGKWTAILPAVSVQDNLTLRVSDGGNSVTFTNVGVGEVWLCSGQSNMDYSLSWSPETQAYISSANYPKIRVFSLAIATQNMSLTPVEEAVSITSWRAITPQNAGGITAVGYFFAKKLFEDLNIPIGIIHSSQGATRVQQWISYPKISEDSVLKAESDAEILATRQKIQSGQTVTITDMRETATACFNGQINPLIPYAIRGVAWYQGEANVQSIGTPRYHPEWYHKMMRMMMDDWRARWNLPGIPFHIVQLANFGNWDMWPILREQQLFLAKNNPNMGLTVTIDVGMVGNIHPVNKWDVGYRLALSALGRTYNRSLVYSGPIYKSMVVAGNAIRISFSQKGSGLFAQGGGALMGFEIAGSNGAFVSASAQIMGDTVVEVSSNTVSAPIAARYAWFADPKGVGCNLYNKELLPASPFRTNMPTSLGIPGPINYMDDQTASKISPYSIKKGRIQSGNQLEGGMYLYDLKGRLIFNTKDYSSLEIRHVFGRLAR